MRVYFVLVAEGSSDRGIVRHIETLCIDAGAEEVSGIAPDFSRLPGIGNSLRDKLHAAVELEPSANPIFIHRDADSRDHRPRHDEIRNAVQDNEVRRPSVAVVPVQETEAWLLLDESAIPRVAANPKGRVALNLPTPSSVERLARPKEVLQRALIAASEMNGRRLERFKNQFGAQRRTLLELLPIGGPLEQVDSLTRLRDDIRAVLEEMA
jgi:hypothetical protein